MMSSTLSISLPQIFALMKCHCRVEHGKDGQIQSVGFFMYDP